MFKEKLKLFLIIIFFFSFIEKSFSIEPSVFVQSTVDRASKVLSSALSKNQKIVELKIIAKDTVDIRGIGFYSLGRYRKELNNDQKTKYVKIFEQYFLKSFSSRLAEYSNPKIDVNSQEKINDNYTIVYSTLLGTDQRPEVKIGWRIYTKNSNKPLIRDLIIEGLSLARTQKEEFASIMQNNNGDINALFSSLDKFINN
tara:strand:+ start:105 stop:701 length:597 start_codon:yes stop_codon:yes gene_type:complete